MTEESGAPDTQAADAAVLDPELAAAGARLREKGLGAPPPNAAPIEEARAGYDDVGAYVTDLVPAWGVEQELLLPGPHGDIPCILIGAERQAAAAPVLAYFHGGGFALGRARDWRGFGRTVARESGASVLLVDYKLSPEHPFPAAFEEAVAVLAHLLDHGAEYGLDPGRVAIGGDSAGANLALSAAASQAAKGAGGLKALLLFYGVYSRDMSHPSWTTFGGFGLSADLMRWIWNGYLGEPRSTGWTDWRAAPLDGNLSGLPAVIQVVGGIDPLIEDARALKARLDAAGVANSLAVESGLNHGFVRLGPLAPRVDAIVTDAARALGRAIAAPDQAPR